MYMVNIFTLRLRILKFYNILYMITFFKVKSIYIYIYVYITLLSLSTDIQ